MANTSINPPKAHIDIRAITSEAQADIAAIKCIIDQYLSLNSQPETEALHGALKLLSMLSRDLEPLFADHEAPVYCRHSITAFHLVDALPIDQRQQAINGFRAVLIGMVGA